MRHHLLWLENGTVELRHNLALECCFALKLLTTVQNGLLRNFDDFGISGTPPFSLSRNPRAGDCRYTCYGGPLLSFGGGDFEVLFRRCSTMDHISHRLGNQSFKNLEKINQRYRTPHQSLSSYI